MEWCNHSSPYIFYKDKKLKLLMCFIFFQLPSVFKESEVGKERGPEE
jgi:hypothetical protein